MFNIQELKPFFTGFKEAGNYITIDCPSCGRKKKAFFYKNTFKMKCNKADCGYTASMCDFLIEFHGFKDKRDVYAYFRKMADYRLPKSDNKDFAKYFVEDYELDIITHCLLQNGVENHPYVIKKQITPYNSLIAVKPYNTPSNSAIMKSGTLMVPLINIEQELKSYIRIFKDKEGKFVKLNLSAKKVEGCFCCLKTMDTKNFILVEGWATGCSLQATTEATVLCCGGFSNIDNVIEALLKRYGNDISLTLGGDRKGREKLLPIAQKYELPWSIPTTEDDWNDVHVEHGLEQVKREFYNNLQQTRIAHIDAATLENKNKVSPPVFLTPFLKEKGSALLYGQEGSMKSWVGLYLLIKGATEGVIFNKWKIKGRGLYVFGEMDYSDVLERIDIIKNKEGIDYELDKSLHLMVHDEDEKCNLNNPLYVDKIVNTIKEKQIKILVLDNLSSLILGLKENSSDEWTGRIFPIIKKFQRAGALVILLHHENKGGGYRGSSAIAAFFDTIIRTQKISEGKSGFLIQKVRSGRRDQLEPFVLGLNHDESPGVFQVLSYEEEMEKKIVSLLEKGCGQYVFTDLMLIFDLLPAEKPILVELLQKMVAENIVAPLKRGKPIFLTKQTVF